MVVSFVKMENQGNDNTPNKKHSKEGGEERKERNETEQNSGEEELNRRTSALAFSLLFCSFQISKFLFTERGSGWCRKKKAHHTQQKDILLKPACLPGRTHRFERAIQS